MHVKSSEYKRFSIAGKGGMGCPCCVPRSGKRSTAAVRTYIRRQAGKREWASFLREQARMEQADIYSAKVEEQARIDAEDELFAQRCREQAEQEHIKRQREQRWLSGMRRGTLFWQHSLQPSGDVWALMCVDDAYDEDEWGAYTRWVADVVHTIALNRATFEWTSTDGWGNQWAVPLMDTCLEELQTAAVANWTLY